MFELIGLTPSKNIQKQNEKERNFNSTFGVIKMSLASSKDIKNAAKNNNLADFMKYYNNFVEKLLVHRYAGINYDDHPEKEFLQRMLDDDNLRENTFKDFGEELYNKYNDENNESNEENTIIKKK